MRSKVLNALRHLIGHHGLHGQRRDTGRQVLNALRHLIGRHQQAANTPQILNLCSTPYGI